jgi:hypothetical protein
MRIRLKSPASRENPGGSHIIIQLPNLHRLHSVIQSPIEHIYASVNSPLDGFERYYLPAHVDPL